MSNLPEDKNKHLKAKAVAMLAVREMSRVEVFKKLRDIYKDEVSTAQINDVLDGLEKLGFLSDERYAHTQARSKIARYGDQRIKYELQRKGISPEMALEAIKQENVPEGIRARALWEKKFGELPKDQKERARQFRYFASRGFSISTISKLLRGSTDYEDF